MADQTLTYWRFHEFAVEAAHYLAEGARKRYRVQRVTWDGAPAGARWHVAPTPAPGPSGVAVEPCS